MFSNPLPINVGTIADPVLVNLPSINQDGYSKEYQLKEADRTHQVVIRHTTEKTKVNGQSIDRHNVTYRCRMNPTELYPQGSLREAYLVVRMPSSASWEDIRENIDGLLHLVGTEAVQKSIVNWES
jgi:hypothetical protein